MSEEIDWTALEAEVADATAVEGLPPEMTILTMDMLAKRLLWDVVPCPMAEQVRDYLGYAPTSEDVEDREHQESHQRLAKVGPILPFLDQMSHMVTPAIVGTMIVGSDDEEHTSEEERNDAIAKLQPVLYQTTLAILSELMDMGLLHLPHRSV